MKRESDLAEKGKECRIRWMPDRKFTTAQLIPQNGRIYDLIARSGKRYTEKEINDLIWIIRLEKKRQNGWREHQTKRFESRMKEIYEFCIPTWHVHMRRLRAKFCITFRKNKKTLIIHLFSSRMSHSENISQTFSPKGFLPGPADGWSEYYKSLSLFDTDFSLLTQKPRHKMFVEHKNVFYHRTKYLGEKLFHRMFVSSDDDDKKFVIAATAAEWEAFVRRFISQQVRPRIRSFANI